MGRFLHPVILKDADIARPKREISADDGGAIERQNSVNESIRELHALRKKMHVPVKKFGSLFGVNTQIMRSLLCGNHYNEGLVKSMLEKGEAELKRKRKNKQMRYMLDTGMTDIIAAWSKALDMQRYSMQQVLHTVADLSGKKYCTLYRWFKDNRKPIDIYELCDIDSKIREHAMR